MNRLDGGAGDDRLSASASITDDDVIGTVTNDLSGGDGDDLLIAVALYSGSGIFDDAPRAINTLSGGEGDDRLTATGSGNSTNVLNGDAGEDVLLATTLGNGSSELFGGEGDDELTVVDGEDNLLDGGAGSDVLRGGDGNDTLIIDVDDLLGSGTTVSGGGAASFDVDALFVDFDLDLTATANERIANIERLDMSGGASNSLTLKLDDVLAATDANDSLIVEGDGAADTGSTPDAANLVGAWTVGGGSGGFTEYVLGGATVSIEADIAVAIV